MPDRALLLKLLPAVILFGAWEVAGRIPVSFAFPTFLESMCALFRMLGDGTMFEAYAETLAESLRNEQAFERWLSTAAGGYVHASSSCGMGRAVDDAGRLVSSEVQRRAVGRGGCVDSRRPSGR